MVSVATERIAGLVIMKIPFTIVRSEGMQRFLTRWRFHGFMLLSVLLFSLNCLMIKWSTRFADVGLWDMVLFRGAVGLLVVRLLYPGPEYQPLRMLQKPMLALRGLVGVAGLILFYLTLLKLDLGRATVLNLSYPVFASLLAALFMKEIIRTSQLWWMFAALPGVAMLCGADFRSWVPLWDAVALIGALFAGGAVALVRYLHKSEHSSVIYASQCFYSVAVAVPLVLHDGAGWSAGSFIWLTLAAVVVAGGQLAMTHAYRSLSVATGSSIQLLLPAVNALAGVWVFGEHYGLLQLIGGAWLLFSCLKVLSMASGGKAGSLKEAMVPSGCRCALNAAPTDSLQEAGEDR
jgi:drug/metabolite transporter (DMT)-like permease